MKKVIEQNNVVQSLVRVNQRQIDLSEFIEEQKKQLVQYLEKCPRPKKQDLMKFDLLKLHSYTIEEIL